MHTRRQDHSTATKWVPDFGITGTVNDILLTEHRKAASSKCISPFQCCHCREGITCSTLTLQTSNIHYVISSHVLREYIYSPIKSENIAATREAENCLMLQLYMYLVLD